MRWKHTFDGGFRMPGVAHSLWPSYIPPKTQKYMTKTRPNPTETDIHLYFDVVSLTQTCDKKNHLDRRSIHDKRSVDVSALRQWRSGQWKCATLSWRHLRWGKLRFGPLRFRPSRWRLVQMTFRPLGLEKWRKKTTFRFWISILRPSMVSEPHFLCHYELKCMVQPKPKGSVFRWKTNSEKHRHSDTSKQLQRSACSTQTGITDVDGMAVERQITK